MTKGGQYKTIFLDWDGTLCSSRFWGEWSKGENKNIYNKIQEDFFAKQGDFLIQWMKGGESAETCVSLLAKITGQPSDVLFDGLRRSCEGMELISGRLPGQIKMLRAKGVRVVIATNNMDTFLRWTVPGMVLGNLVDDILDSYSLKALKREVSQSGRSPFFSDYLTANSLLPGEALLIDDNAKNKVVEKFGICFEQITQNKSLTQILGSLADH